jgi:flavodoxin
MQEELTMEKLISTFEDAIDFNVKYVAVKIQMDEFAKPEIIVNERENFADKLSYYRSAYDFNLTLKTRSSIKIVDCTYGNTFKELEDYLVD